MTGLEPATSGSTVRCSNQLSYIPKGRAAVRAVLAGRESVVWKSTPSTSLRQESLVPSQERLSRQLVTAPEVSSAAKLRPASQKNETSRLDGGLPTQRVLKWENCRLPGHGRATGRIDSTDPRLKLPCPD